MRDGKSGTIISRVDVLSCNKSQIRVQGSIIIVQRLKPLGSEGEVVSPVVPGGSAPMLRDQLRRGRDDACADLVSTATAVEFMPKGKVRGVKCQNGTIVGGEPAASWLATRILEIIIISFCP